MKIFLKLLGDFRYLCSLSFFNSARLVYQSFVRNTLTFSIKLLNFKQSYFDIVRIGLIIYGVRHFVKIEDSFCLKPVLSMHSYILSLKTIPKGRAVSYSCSWIAPKKCNIALVPMGYSWNPLAL